MAITKNTINWNVNSLTKAFADGTITFGNAIQRGFVWDKKRMSKLPYSIIMGYPIPAIYSIETDERVMVKGKEKKVYDCIDGKQRSTTLYKFLNNEFALEGLDPIAMDDGTELDLNGKTFEELDEDMQNDIKQYPLTMYAFSDITDEQVAEMMSLLNNGKPLTGTENARIRAKHLDIIQKIASHAVLTENLSATAIKKYDNEDIVIKLALLMDETKELSNDNIRKAYETYNFGENKIKEINETFDFVKYALEEATDDKKIIKKIIKKANLITVCYVAWQYMNEVEGEYEDKVSEFADRISKFFDGEGKGGTISEDYNNACTNATMRASNVDMRNSELYDYVMSEEEDSEGTED